METAHEYLVLIDNDLDVARALCRSHLCARDAGDSHSAKAWEAAIACYVIATHPVRVDGLESPTAIQTTVDRLIASGGEGIAGTLTAGINPRTGLTGLLKVHADKAASLACKAYLLARDEGDDDAADIWGTVLAGIATGVHAPDIHCPSFGAFILVETSSLIGQVEDELTIACIYC